MQISKELEKQLGLEEFTEVSKVSKNVEDEEDRIREIEIEAKSRQVFDPVERVFDERKREVT